MADDLVVHLARFAGALREHGVAAGIGDEIDATNALSSSAENTFGRYRNPSGSEAGASNRFNWLCMLLTARVPFRNR